MARTRAERGEGTITVYAGDPYESDRQVELGKVNLHADEPDVMTMKSITVSNSDRLKGKMPVYFRFESDKKDVSLCDFYTPVSNNQASISSCIQVYGA